MAPRPKSLELKLILYRGSKRRLCIGDLYMDPGQLAYIVYGDLDVRAGKVPDPFSRFDAGSGPDNPVRDMRRQLKGVPVEDQVGNHDLSTIWSAGSIKRFCSSLLFGTYFDVGGKKIGVFMPSKHAVELIKAWCRENGVKA